MLAIAPATATAQPIYRSVDAQGKVKEIVVVSNSDEIKAQLK